MNVSTVTLINVMHLCWQQEIIYWDQILLTLNLWTVVLYWDNIRRRICRLYGTHAFQIKQPIFLSERACFTNLTKPHLEGHQGSSLKKKKTYSWSIISRDFFSVTLGLGYSVCCHYHTVDIYLMATIYWYRVYMYACLFNRMQVITAMWITWFPRSGYWLAGL